MKTVVDFLYIKISMRSPFPICEGKGREFERFSKSVHVWGKTELLKAALNPTNVIFLDFRTSSMRSAVTRQGS